MKRIGSSLVLVVVIIASVIVVVFGASRLTLVQYNQSNRDEDNIYALYAAKAAVEDGLMRFRYNRNAETTTADGTTATVSRYDLTTGTSLGEVDATTPISAATGYAPAHQYYDLKVGYRDSQVGSFTDTTGQNPTLAQDDTLELTGFPNVSNVYYLRYRFEFVDAGSGCASAFVQLQQVSQNADTNSPISYEQVSAKKQPGTAFIDSTDAVSPGNLFIHLNPGGQSESLTSSIRLRAYGCAVRYALATSLSSRGNGQDSDAGPKFDNLKTTVTATGYYGQAKRTLVATIDRVSGRLISVYDFNVYAGQGNVSP